VLVVSKPAIRLPSGPLLSRANNFAALRDLLATDNGRFSSETLLLGNDYARVELRPELGRGVVEFISVAENFFIAISELEFAADCAFKYLGENWIRFSFNLSGTAQMLFDGRESATVESRMSHLLLHPEGVVHSDHYYGGSPGRWVSILCRKEHLTEIVGFDPEAFPQELKRFLAHGETSLYLNKRPLNVPMFRCVTEIFRKPSVIALRPLYLKGKAYEALYTFLDDFAADTPRTDRRQGLSRRDVDRLYEVRALLERDPSREIGLAHLSREVGLNRSKLSQGFHSLFGTTIFDFTRLKRMETAYELLRSSDLPIGQIAERCGYQHASSFSAAFRAQYGRRPRATRKK
jgi:AraC-like DNA-binding protein